MNIIHDDERNLRAARSDLVHFLIILLPQVFFVIYLISVQGLYYVTSDDLLIADILRNAFKGGSWDAVNISPVISSAFSRLYCIFPRTSWFGIILVALQFIAMITSDSIISGNTEDIHHAILFSILSFACWYQIWWDFTYTTVAFSLVITGMLIMINMLLADCYMKGGG